MAYETNKSARVIQCQLLILICFMSFGVPCSYANVSNPLAYQKLEEKTRVNIRNKLSPLLNQYCGESCMIINVETEIRESIQEVNDLGFESLSERTDNYEYYVDQVVVHVQIDRRVTQANREKLSVILNNHIKDFGVATRINWVMVELPKIGQSASLAQHLKGDIRRKVEEAVGLIIDKYCPDQCVLSDVSVSGQLITPDEAEALDPREVIVADSSHTVLKVNQVQVSVSIDENLPEESRNNIVNLMRAKTRFVRPVSIKARTVEFPESWEDKRKRESLESEDPYGLEKLRRMLTMFRELAGTKEIISKSESRDSSSRTSASEISESSSERAEQKGEGSWFWYIVAFIILFGVVAIGLIRFTQAGKDARMMMQAIGESESSGCEEGQKKESQDHPQDVARDIRDQLEFQTLKDELIDIFVNQPKVAKETFSRLLQEEGVEEAANYVYIFGKIIVFELLADSTMQRSLYELSEYYHKSTIELDLAEKIKLLEKLKRKVTANEIRVMARQTIDQFDFIEKLDSNQIFNLMRDEDPQVQSIILTQVSRKRRKLVFEMFEGKEKINLMNELCKADAIPREYLYNVAMALSKKVLSKPEFDTQSLRSSDIILELLEKASLHEQKVLMKNLMETNTEAARAIKQKLITIEILPYLKGGHLLELVLGLESSDLLNFLGGCPEAIKDLLLSNAPEELAESWLEELEMMAGVEEANYRLVEMKILQKVRQLANNGAINLLELNEMIFSNLEDIELAEEEETGILDERNLVA